jgi:hypothetical protein
MRWLFATAPLDEYQKKVTRRQINNSGPLKKGCRQSCFWATSRVESPEVSINPWCNREDCFPAVYRPPPWMDGWKAGRQAAYAKPSQLFGCPSPSGIPYRQQTHLGEVRRHPKEVGWIAALNSSVSVNSFFALVLSASYSKTVIELLLNELPLETRQPQCD